MSTPIEARVKLDEYRDELDQLSRALTKVTRDLEPVEKEYQGFVDDFEVGLWKKHQEDGQKFPSEAMRLKLAHAEMPAVLLGRHSALVHSRDRMMKRISTLKLLVEAQRSILSALKLEVEAS